MAKNFPLCVYCGKEPGVTDDHVPPKAIFPKPRPGNLHKVPACPACNNSFSAGDEVFALVLAILDGDHTEQLQKLFERVRRSVRYNRRYQQAILRAFGALPIFGPSGDIDHWVYSLSEADFVIEPVLERIVVGLTFVHYDIRVQKTGYVEIFRPTKPTMRHPFLTNTLAGCQYSHVGHNHEFRYRHGQAHDAKNATVWEFVIYDRFHYMAVTRPLVWL